MSGAHDDDVAPLPEIIRSLGRHGATANAHRSLLERAGEDFLVASITRRLALIDAASVAARGDGRRGAEGQPAAA